MSSTAPSPPSPAPPSDPGPWGPWAAPLACFLVALALRLLLVALVPGNWHYDGYQRWAGRDHLVVQVWLPATQLLVWGVAKLGGGLVALRVLLSVVGAVGVALGSALAQGLAGPRAGWAFLPMALFGPFLCWSVVPYQESTFLLLVFGALLLRERWPALADLTMGALALVRYEGWPLILVWMAMRRTPATLLSLWGVALWLRLKTTGLAEPFAASPDSFADWQDLTERWTLKRQTRLFRQLWYQGSAAGTPWLVMGLLLAPLRRPWSFELRFLLWALAGQVAALLGWAAALGVTSSRMMVLPSLFLGVMTAAALARRWPTLGPRGRIVLVLFTVGLSGWTLRDGISDGYKYMRWVHWELPLVASIEACPGDRWAISPRTQKGIRKRHDGCEVVQGLTTLRAGEDFDCLTWGWGGPPPSLVATWTPETDRYEVQRVDGAGAATCPH